MGRFTGEYDGLRKISAILRKASANTERKNVKLLAREIPAPPLWGIWTRMSLERDSATPFISCSRFSYRTFTGVAQSESYFRWVKSQYIYIYT